MSHHSSQASITRFAILLFCTYLTVQIALRSLVLNTVAALVIATFKATIVVLFFMHEATAPG